MSNVPASKEIIEMFLIEQYHWTPKQINEIPYKKIQQIFLIINQKHAVDRINSSRKQLESQTRSSGNGRGRKMYREI